MSTPLQQLSGGGSPPSLPSWKPFYILLISIGAFLFIIGETVMPGHHTYTGASMWTMGLGMLFLFLPIGISFTRSSQTIVHQQVQAMNRPIPSIPELKRQLEEELGTPVSLEDVIMVHRMLTDQRNQAALRLGLTVGALYLAHRQASGDFPSL